VHAWDTCQLRSRFRTTLPSFETKLLPRVVEPHTRAPPHEEFGRRKHGSGGKIVRPASPTAEEGIRYALSQPIGSLVVGIDSTKVLEQDVRIASHSCH